jgi:predicted metal-dependent phosphoesterase TrpH
MAEHRVKGEQHSHEREQADSSGRADLHTHTTYSDGVLTPHQLIQKAYASGIDAIAITDHDNVAAIDEAVEWGRSVGIFVVPGVELSITFGQKDIHLLAYFIDHRNEKLLEYLTFFRQERLKRAERMVAKLNKINVPLKLEAVLEQAGAGSVGRPHIAHALVEEGLTDSYHEAFEKYIGWGGPAYEKKFQLTPPEAFRLVNSVGGLSFFAHPGRYTNETESLELIKLGLDGIEVIHPSHNENQTQYYREIAHQYFMLESGGSDFHGGRGTDDSIFGAYTVPMEFVEAMRKRLFV